MKREKHPLSPFIFATMNMNVIPWLHPRGCPPQLRSRGGLYVPGCQVLRCSFVNTTFNLLSIRCGLPYHAYEPIIGPARCFDVFLQLASQANGGGSFCMRMTTGKRRVYNCPVQTLEARLVDVTQGQDHTLEQVVSLLPHFYVCGLIT